MAVNLKNKWLFIPAALIGVLVFALMARNPQQPDRRDLSETSRAVRVIDAPLTEVIPVATGTGTVRPGQTWTAVAQISGVITDINPDFRKGAVLKKGDIVLKIDPADYDLAIAQAHTNIEAVKAQLADLDLRKTNTETLLEIEMQALELNQKELGRLKRVLSKGSISASEFDKEQRSVLMQQQSVQAQMNALKLYPAERDRLNAELAKFQSQLAAAQLDLERTTLIMPFNGRISSHAVELNQYVRQGEILGIADSSNKAEIEVQMPMRQVAGLLRGNTTVAVENANFSNIIEQLGLSATVQLRHSGLLVDWPARVMRFSDTLDPKTRTVGIIVEVDEPYANVRPGTRPPLLKGLFVDVEFRGRPRPDSLVVPISALHDNLVYVVDEDNRLQRRPVELGLVGGQYAVINAGLQAGEQIVVSDLVPAIEGMLLKPVPDPESREKLLAEANARTYPQ